jgi:glycosyltransferase involved in cell wall biosynthesis
MTGKNPGESADSRTLTVALVTETWPPEVNGVAHTLANLVAGLDRRGHRLQLLRPRQGPTDLPGGRGNLVDLPLPGMPIPGYRGLRFGLPARARLRRLWSQQPPSIVHVATEGPLGASAIAAAVDLGLPVSSGFHTNFDAYSRHYRLGWLRGIVRRHLRRLHNRTALTLAPTAELARALTDDGFRGVDVLARGVDTRLFSPHRRSESLRGSWGASPDTLVCACVGRLAPEKNLNLVVRAFEAIAERRPDSRLLLVGDGPLRRQLASRLADRGLAHTLAGMRHGEDLASHYASADLFLFPSLTETYGNVVPEALASGLAVVAFAVAAAADLIEDGINGCLVPADTVAADRQAGEAAFIAAAADLAANPARIEALRSIAGPSVAHLDWERIHDRFDQLLRQVVAQHSQPADGGAAHGL